MFLVWSLKRQELFAKEIRETSATERLQLLRSMQHFKSKLVGSFSMNWVCAAPEKGRGVAASSCVNHNDFDSGHCCEGPQDSSAVVPVCTTFYPLSSMTFQLSPREQSCPVLL